MLRVADRHEVLLLTALAAFCESRGLPALRGDVAPADVPRQLELAGRAQRALEASDFPLKRKALKFLRTYQHRLRVWLRCEAAARAAGCDPLEVLREVIKRLREPRAGLSESDRAFLRSKNIRW